MAVNLKGLTDNARKTSIAELNARLADAVALSAAIKQAHWNVKGRNFIAVHELFDQVFANLQAHVDTMAERVQQLDGVAIGTVEKVAKASSLKEYPTDLTKAEDHLKAVSDRMRDYGEKLRKAIDSTDEAGDADTADLFTAASRTADKDLWFMESHLE
ncbi:MULTISPECIES: DNA starvation/stationary phase protection protein Dps [unclassified Paracoccus (in: a-proteobacteria)]|uniref:DNA starvation/stationary phase protection protein Dps n=1 Tax=unclassified Paracoccus (in: a-proteobacteria) TaxID=2688777 RepID=UPI0012B1F77C|nr:MULTISPECIES: DNA starvation/stationary phase protection protein Dps [unclassified Paracoccus (in: a-proteobacteria)]UXU74384.1 DNA starvation/stationary phase protection protein Dps [Paracoccus sp. SMMA_5]UXU80274.1 DNA starvation/stationary phase protection protein Dps [Paracoccus sp. SMMA_5_TC]